ncbi:transcriptional regulatory protein Dot6p [Monosporozyma servazzii]
MERLLNSDTHKIVPKDVVKATNNNNSPSTNNHSASKNKNPSSWEPIDDILLRHLKEIKKMGWKEISQYFNNRTPNACQFRWRRLKSGNLKSNKTALMDVTVFPGEIKLLNPCNNTKIDKSDNKIDKTENNNKIDKETIKLPIINTPQQNQMPPPPPPQQTTQLAPLKFTQNKNTFNSNRRNSSISNNIIHNNNNNNNNNDSTFSPRGSISLNHPAPSFIDSTNDVLIENETSQNFIKPRSYSHSLTSHAMTPVNSTNSSSSSSNFVERENLGFIPKVFVKSRRSSSFIVPPTSPISVSQSFNNALNTTLTTSKSRKNSFVHYQRRYSLAAVSSTSSSRRSSIVAAPNSMSVNFNNYQLPTSKQRRESVIRTHKITTTTHTKQSTTNLDPPVANHHSNENTHLFNHNYTFTDMPTSNPTIPSNTTTTSTTRKHPTHWSVQEDQLLLENKYRNLSLPELSILLPNKSESDIDSRLNSLNANNITSQANENAVESSSSSNSPTPQLQLPEYVSPIHSPTRSLILNQSDSIINSQEYKDHLELGSKRSGTAESQTSSKGVSPSEFSQTSQDNDTASSISSVSMNAGNNNNMKNQDYSTLLRSARQTSNDHSSIPHHHDSIEQNNTHQLPPQIHHQQIHQQGSQQLPSINTIFQGI